MTDAHTPREPPAIRLQQGAAGKASLQLTSFRLLVRVLFLMLFRVRIVGMDDFIVGPQGRKVNAFYDIVMGLVQKHPGKVHFGESTG